MQQMLVLHGVLSAEVGGLLSFPGRPAAVDAKQVATRDPRAKHTATFANQVQSQIQGLIWAPETALHVLQASTPPTQARRDAATAVQEHDLLVEPVLVPSVLEADTHAQQKALAPSVLEADSSRRQARVTARPALL